MTGVTRDVIELGEVCEQEDPVLVERALRGDDDALGALLARYRPFVRAKARPFFLVGGDREDLVQEGMIGLYKAIRDFDASREAAFRAFAEVCITRQIISAIKAATRHKHTPLNGYISLHLPAFEQDDADEEMLTHVVSELPDPADSAVHNSELSEFQDFCRSVLSELEVEVLTRYVQGDSYQEIAAVLNRHVKAVDNAIQRVKRKLEPYLATRDLREVV